MKLRWIPVMILSMMVLIIAGIIDAFIPGFICDACKEKNHTECLGKSQCDCQHRPSKENQS